MPLGRLSVARAARSSAPHRQPYREPSGLIDSWHATLLRITCVQQQAKALAKMGATRCAAREAQREARMTCGVEHGYRVLVVDDDVACVQLVRDVLEDEGCRVVMAATRDEALAASAGERLDLIILDVRMPGNGQRLADLLGERCHDVPIIFLSAGLTPAWLPAGVPFVAKPFDIARLVEVMRRTLASRPAASACAAAC